jgi:hypothetical protein
VSNNRVRERRSVVEFSYKGGLGATPRVSILEQDASARLNALTAAGVKEVYIDHASGVRSADRATG